MNKLRVEPKAYHKKSTMDSMPTTQLVNPELRKRNEKRIKLLVDTLNKNTLKESKDSD
tara:strand:- start:1004 stop:1177 length:174 start_codon:yes stop_codon:yes gene_type:complete